MIYKEEKRDLFRVPKDYWLAHCISADFGMGKGIVLEFNKRFDMKNQMMKNFPRNIWDGHGYCRVVPGIPVFNLITKERYWQVPTYQTLRGALEEMAAYAAKHDIGKIAMPLIGCGLDKLKWEKVSVMIQDVFKDSDIEILVCIR